MIYKLTFQIQTLNTQTTYLGKNTDIALICKKY